MIKSIINFCKNPSFKIDQRLTQIEKAKFLFWFIIADLIIILYFSFFLFIFKNIFLDIVEGNRIITFWGKSSKWEIILLLIIIIPFVEELTYRLPLKINFQYSLLYAYISLVSIVIYFINPISLSGVIVYFSITLLALLLYFLFNEKIIEFVKRIWNKEYRSVFYFSIFLFCFSHILNYKITLSVLLFFPILILPQFFLGLSAGYLRVRQGFLWGYLLHISHNTVALILIPLFIGLLSDNGKQTSFKDYNIKIEQCSEIPTKPIMKITNDSILIEGVSLKNIFIEFSAIDTEQIVFSNIDNANLLLNVQFSKNANSTNTQKSTILVLMEILNKYNLQFIKEKRKVENWNMILINSEALLKHAVNSNYLGKENEFIRTGKYLIFKNTDLNYLTNIVQDYYHIKIHNTISTHLKCNFKLPISEFNSLIAYLKYNYGINIVLQQEEKSFFLIKSKGN